MHVLVSDTSVPVDPERGSFLEISFRRSGAFHPCRNTEPQTQLPENSVQCGEPGIAVFREGLIQGLTPQTGPLGDLGKTPRFDNVAERNQ